MSRAVICFGSFVLVFVFEVHGVILQGIRHAVGRRELIGSWLSLYQRRASTVSEVNWVSKHMHAWFFKSPQSL